jgi:ribonuclease BN (tRNA processing enzyme)
VDLAVREVMPGDGTFEVAGFDVRAFEGRHSMRSHAYRFGDALCFSGDTEAFEGLASFADGVGVLVHDCSFPDDVDVSNHPTPSQLGAALAGHTYGRLYLTHLYPHTEGRHEEMLASLRAAHGGDIDARVARDGTTLEVDADAETGE